MRRLYHNSLLKNVIYSRNINRSLCQLNKIVQNSSKINKTSNKYVSLTTKFCNAQIVNVNVASLPSISSCAFRNYCSPPNSYVDNITFERVCEETLQSLCDYFEELIENSTHLQETDVMYSSGVLTVNFGEPYGTYVINRQSPNHQIWLSSPTSGPKRYDFIPDGNYWVYKHDNVALHDLLQKEIKEIIKKDIDFTKCTFGCKL